VVFTDKEFKIVLMLLYQGGAIHEKKSSDYGQ
jgi:hypothetical protein